MNVRAEQLLKFEWTEPSLTCFQSGSTSCPHLLKNEGIRQEIIPGPPPCLHRLLRKKGASTTPALPSSLTNSGHQPAAPRHFPAPRPAPCGFGILVFKAKPGRLTPRDPGIKLLCFRERELVADRESKISRAMAT